MNTSPHLPSASARASQERADSRLSAFVDGELDARELDALLQSLDDEEGTWSVCQRYEFIGDVLRASPAAATRSVSHAFVADVRARLQADVQPNAGAETAPSRQVAAANDPVFRWKLVAGVASLAAVMAVSWNLLGREPGGPGGAGGAAAQLALNNPPVSTPVAVGREPSQVEGAVLVSTAQGPVLRDVRLEELLAEHRQYGGMSALQMPAGFLRDATYQNAPQR